MKPSIPEFEAIRDRLMPILETQHGPLSQAIVPGCLYFGVFWQGPTGPQRVTARVLKQWDKTFASIIEIAKWNLRRKTPATGWTEIDTIGGLYTYFAKDGFASSRALCLEDLVRPWPFEGVLVSCPTRDQLYVLPMNYIEVLQAMRVMVLAGNVSRIEGAVPLSNQLYWYDGTTWEQIQIVHRSEQIEIQPSTRFMDALERITAVNMMTAAEA